MLWTAPHHRRSLGAAEMEERHGRGRYGRFGHRQVGVPGAWVDAAGQVVVQRRLTRAKLVRFFEKLPPCRAGIEACATAHRWGRRLTELGHEVKLMPPSYVKRQKTDAADAEAIREGVTRPSMRFVEVKRPAEQSELVIHRTRMTLMRHRIELSNTIRAHMAELGLVAPIGRMGLQGLVAIVRAETDERVPASARICLKLLAEQLDLINRHALETDRMIRASARATEVGRRLMAVPGVGPVLASAIVASVPDPHAFKSGRNLAAWIGLVPRQNSSGGKARLGGITSRATATCASCRWSAH